MTQKINFDFNTLKQMHKLIKRGYSQRDIAKLYHVHNSTVSRFLGRYSNPFLFLGLWFKKLVGGFPLR